MMREPVCHARTAGASSLPIPRADAMASRDGCQDALARPEAETQCAILAARGEVAEWLKAAPC
jgi:hypothetical protein